jgi:hypothetical protein
MFLRGRNWVPSTLTLPGAFELPFVQASKAFFFVSSAPLAGLSVFDSPRFAFSHWSQPDLRVRDETRPPGPRASERPELHGPVWRCLLRGRGLALGVIARRLLPSPLRHARSLRRT